MSLSLGFELPWESGKEYSKLQHVYNSTIKKKVSSSAYTRHFLLNWEKQFFMGPKKRKRDGVAADIFKRSHQKIVNFAHTWTQNMFLTQGMLKLGSVLWIHGWDYLNSYFPSHTQWQRTYLSALYKVLFVPAPGQGEMEKVSVLRWAQDIWIR